MRLRYSLVTRTLWSDARFLGLSGPEPNAQTLWMYLLLEGWVERQRPRTHLGVAGLGSGSEPAVP